MTDTAQTMLADEIAIAGYIRIENGRLLTGNEKRLLVAALRSPAIGTPDDAREAWWKILADNWRGRNGNSTTGDSVRNSCADELEKVAKRALAALPREQEVKPVAWHLFDFDNAPRDRPIGLLSIQPQDSGGFYITFDICQWRGNCFVLGYGFDTKVGNGCATHWCEISELNLPVAALSPASPNEEK